MEILFIFVALIGIVYGIAWLVIYKPFSGRGSSSNYKSDGWFPSDD